MSAIAVAPVVWDKEQVEAKLIEAFWTLSRLPDHELQWFKVKACWVDYPEEYGEEKQDTPPVSRPSRRELAEWQEVTEWLRWIENADHQRLVAVCVVVRRGQQRTWNDYHPVQKIRWDRVEIEYARINQGRKYPYKTRAMRRHYMDALDTIAAKLRERDMYRIAAQ